MIRYPIYIITLLLGLTACHDQRSQPNELCILDSTKNNGEKRDTTTLKQDNREYVSDTVRNIIDELNLCEYSEFLNTSDNYSCYDKDMCDIRNIKSGDFSYDNFIFQAPGGSAGGAIIVFCKQNGKYKKIQEDQGCLVEILKTITNEYFDLILWHRAHKPDGEYALYKWDGKKYMRINELRDYKE